MADYMSDAARRRRTLRGTAPELPSGSLGPFGERWEAAGYGAIDPMGLTSGAIGLVDPDTRDYMRSRKSSQPDAAMAGGLMSPLSVLPYTAGAKGAAAAMSAARAHPVAAGGLLGGLAIASPSAIGADDDGLTAAQREELTSLKAKMTGKFKTPAERRATERRVADLEGIQAEFSRAQNKALQDQDTAKVLEADAVRRDRLDKADKPFAKQFPAWNAVQPFVPIALGAATTAPFLARNAMAEQAAVNAWRGAARDGLKATRADELADASRRATAYADTFKGKSGGIKGAVSDYPVPAVVGAIEGGVAANLPEAYNAMLPSVNPEVEAYREYIKRLPPGHREAKRAEDIIAGLPQTMTERDAAFKHFGSSNVLKRAGVGAFEGAGGGVLAATLAKGIKPPVRSYPTAETEALRGRMAGAGLDDATKALAAESEAMRTVLPLPAARQQLPAEPMRQRGGLIDDLPPPPTLPRDLPPSQLPPPPPAPAPSIATAQPQSKSRFGPEVYGAGAAGAAGIGAIQNPDVLAALVRAGLLPPSVLDGAY